VKYEELTKSHSDAVAAHAKELAQLKEEHASKYEELSKSHDDAVTAHVKELTQLKEEHASSTAATNSSISEYQETLEALKASHAKSLDEAHDRAITAGHTAHVTELEQLQAKHDSAIAALKKEHASSLEAATSSDVKQREVKFTRPCFSETV
jgi:hypothetical protein